MPPIAPAPQSHSIPIAVSESGHTTKQINSFESVIRYAGQYAQGAEVRLTMVLTRMQLTLDATHRTPQGSSRLVHAMPAWSVKTRRAPSRRGRDARIIPQWSQDYFYA